MAATASAPTNVQLFWGSGSRALIWQLYVRASYGYATTGLRRVPLAESQQIFVEPQPHHDLHTREPASRDPFTGESTPRP